MTLINLLPHPVHIITPDGIVTIRPSGRMARVIEHEEESAPIGAIPTSIVMHGGMTDLPDPSPGTKYIVSKVVLMASDRNDLYCPMGIVRDDNGNVLGCTHLGRRA